MNPDLPTRLKILQERIDAAVERSKRSPGAVTLLVVTKTHPPELVQSCYDLGLRDFGENRVREALSKIQALPTDIRWHLIGRLQTNKINKIVGRFSLIHSVDSSRLGMGLSERLPSDPQEILLEVNTSGEPSKTGVQPSGAVQAARELLSLPNLRLRGLMTVGPLTENDGKRRESFKLLREILQKIREAANDPGPIDQLSMGMSSDFEAAIEEGATLVRIGSALLGDRPSIHV